MLGNYTKVRETGCGIVVSDRNRSLYLVCDKAVVWIVLMIDAYNQQPKRVYDGQGTSLMPQLGAHTSRSTT